MSALAKAERLARRGYQRHKQGDLLSAVRYYAQALRLAPDFPDALHHAALVARQLSQHARAKGLPGAIDQSSRLMLLAIERATEIAVKVHAHDPRAFEAGTGQSGAVRRLYAAMVHNHAWFQKDRGNIDGPDGARILYEECVKFDPNLCEAWVNLGHVYGELGLRLRAEACWHRALECPTPSPEATYNLAFVKLMQGNYLEGWPEYEARWASPVFLASYGRPDLPAPRWDGEPLDGTLYLHGEQGAGDVIMMARYIPIIETGVRTVIVEVLPALVRLFQHTFPHLHIVARGDPAPAHDAQLPMMSLPAVFGTLLEMVPPPLSFDVGPIPVEPNEEGVLVINADTGAEPGRIGLCWKGSPTHPNDRARSMPFDAVRPLFDVPGLTWQSLQYAATEGHEMLHRMLPLEANDFLDTARAIARCELVITVDTSIAHLAGSMGVPTWVLLPPSAEWRWMQDRTDTPWYPSVRLWRQRAPNWPFLVGEVAAALRERISA